MHLIRKGWKPVEQYSDLDGIETRYANREAFQAFVRDFGWSEYMFDPVVIDFGKLLAGSDDYNKPDPLALASARHMDGSFKALGGHTRAFRTADGVVMLAAVIRPERLLDAAAWTVSHGCRHQVCGPSRAFHNNGKDVLVLFFDEGTGKLYGPVLDAYLT